MHTYSGVHVNLAKFSAHDIRILDIARSLQLINRFNGHTMVPFSVAEHSIIGSYMSVDPKHKMEALLHDAAEAYVGDIILPLKDLFPDIVAFEDKIAAIIFDELWPNNTLTHNGVYVKSPYMRQLDKRLAEWESMALRPTHGIIKRVWDTRDAWQEADETLRNDKKYTPIEDIFVSEYYKLQDAIKI